MNGRQKEEYTLKKTMVRGSGKKQACHWGQGCDLLEAAVMSETRKKLEAKPEETGV